MRGIIRQRIVNALAQAADGLHRDQLMSTVYYDDPNGGPAFATLRVNIWHNQQGIGQARATASKRDNGRDSGRCIGWCGLRHSQPRRRPAHADPRPETLAGTRCGPSHSTGPSSSPATAGSPGINTEMQITREWAMPAKWTFEIFQVRKLLVKYAGDGKNWADPFAGQSSFAEFRNDLNPENKQPYCMEAADFMQKMDGLDGVIFDPPYSIAQVKISYDGIGGKIDGDENATGGFPRVRDEIARAVKASGHAISFGWNTVGMGYRRGFEIVEIMIVSHGGNRNDTLCTVERRLPDLFNH